jgi:hypothetical protein
MDIIRLWSLSSCVYKFEKLFSFTGEPGSGEGKHKDNLPITPNYLSNPPFPYISGSSNFRQPENHASLPPSHKHTSHTPQPGDTPVRNGTSRTPVQDENGKFLLMKFFVQIMNQLPCHTLSCCKKREKNGNVKFIFVF